MTDETFHQLVLQASGSHGETTAWEASEVLSCDIEDIQRLAKLAVRLAEHTEEIYLEDDCDAEFVDLVRNAV